MFQQLFGHKVFSGDIVDRLLGADWLVLGSELI